MRLSLGYPEGSAVLKLCLGMRAWRPHSRVTTLTSATP